jgi:hypothetical protein
MAAMLFSNTLPAIIGQHVGMAAEQGRNLGFDGLPQ